MPALRRQLFVGVLDQDANRVGIVGAAVGIVGVNGCDNLTARDAIRPVRNQVDDALAHRPMHRKPWWKRPMACWAKVRASAHRADLRNRATCAITPSGLTTGVQSRPPNSSRSMTWRGPKMRGVDLDFAPCKPLKPFDFLKGFVGFPVS